MNDPRTPAEALSEERIADLRELAKSSCSAAWNKDFTYSLLRHGRKNFDFDWDNAEDKSDFTPDDYDAKFILLAQRLIPALLAERDALREVAAIVERLRASAPKYSRAGGGGAQRFADDEWSTLAELESALDAWKAGE